MSGKQKTCINNLESEEQANGEEFISFSRVRKKELEAETKGLSKIHENHPGVVQETARNKFWAVPTRASGEV